MGQKFTVSVEHNIVTLFSVYAKYGNYKRETNQVNLSNFACHCCWMQSCMNFLSGGTKPKIYQLQFYLKQLWMIHMVYLSVFNYEMFDRSWKKREKEKW